jgi:prolyl oligopeptidase
VAFNKARQGNENPIVRLMEVATENPAGRPEGVETGGIAWLPDNSGFLYSAQPLKGEVPGGEEYYWRTWSSNTTMRSLF